jgi:FKBP-type peptidyl-prolyl cis-trans isomerase
MGRFARTLINSLRVFVSIFSPHASSKVIYLQYREQEFADNHSKSRSGHGWGRTLRFPDLKEIMRYSLFNRATQTVLIALSASGFIMAKEAPKAASKEAPKPAAKEAPAAAVADIKADSSYAVGYSAGSAFAENFGVHGLTLGDFDMEVFMKAYKAAAQGKKPEMDTEKLQAAMMSLSQLIEAREKSLAEANAKAGAEFLAKNGKREGVTTNKSGLQYEVLAKGGNERYVAPTDGSPGNKLFVVNYKGTKIDGTQFDASEEGKPVEMSLQVVEGFREALTSMPVGAKWKLYIPSGMAYGERRASVDIGPNSTLIFEIELVGIKDAPPQPALPEGFQLPGAE